MGQRLIKNTHTIADLHRIAARRLPRFVLDYIDGGADTERAVRRNIEAFSDVSLTPRYLVDTRQCVTSTTLLGGKWEMPVGIAPTGLAGLIATNGDIHRAIAAREAGVPFVLSLASSNTIEEVAEAAPGHVWYQHYPLRDEKINDDIMRRVSASGIDVLVVTVDVPTSSKRLRDLRNGLDVPVRLNPSTFTDIMLHPVWALHQLRAGTPRLVNIASYADPSSSACTLLSYMASQNITGFDWEALARLRNSWKERLVLKGLLHPGDIEQAIAAGADGVIVSNHGGRQFDASPAPIDVIAMCCRVARNRIPIMIDSGIRNGLDVIRAHALGAQFCFVGRPSLYGLAASFDKAGPARMLAILRDEIERALRQVGRPDIAAVDASLLSDRRRFRNALGPTSGE